MPLIFTDTSALVALFDKADSNHAKAVDRLEIIKKQRLKLLLSDYIFDETITTVLSCAGHKTAVQVGDFILASNIVELVWLKDSVKIKAWEYFKKHADKDYSFTDCTSFVLMQEKKIREFFAFDSDFKKAGFLDFTHNYK